jgi:hypothetical protein
MLRSKAILFKKIENKTITWFENTNKYIVLEHTAAKIIADLTKSIPIETIARNLSEELSIPSDKVLAFVSDLEKKLYIPNAVQKENTITSNTDFKEPKVYKFSKKYLINKRIIKVDFESEVLLYFVQPKFAHLETENNRKEDVNYRVFTHNKKIILLVDKKFIGAWNEHEIHFFQGKFSMQLVQTIHQKEEREWLGVFHASAVSNTKHSMLFLGDSGNGKSTSLALLQANGFDCLADDFVPIHAENQEVYSFPSAISIKKNSLKTLLPIYPELETAGEFHFKRLNKIVRYLPPNNDNYTNHLPCKALVFIKYQEKSELVFHEISKIKAFEKLIPDSWLSPKKENAQLFLEWFEKLPCYEITYSNNHKLIEAVTKLFTNEL